MAARVHFDGASAAASLYAIRKKRPLVLSLTNSVVTNLTANILLAAGASPVMLEDDGEAAELAGKSEALVVNLGTVDATAAGAMERAVASAQQAGRPWVLDPVGVGALSYRTTLARQLMRFGPAAIKGNASEIIALSEEGGGGRGVDSVAGPRAAIKGARRLAKHTGAVIAITGPVDLVTDGTSVVEVQNGHSLMAQITGMGCSAAAIMGACMAVADASLSGRLAAAVHALALLNVSAEIAARSAQGPASLQVGIIDTLYALSGSEVNSLARIRVSARLNFDPTLCLVADPAAVGDRSLPDLVAAAVAGGVTMVQLRDKASGTRRFVECARELRSRLHPMGVPLLINDRIDVALAVGADGVHLGQTDLLVQDARQMLGEGAIIGLSITRSDEAQWIDPTTVDYLGVGPIFPTLSKPDSAEPLGPAGLAAVRELVPSVPLLAIGGLDTQNIPRLFQAAAVDGIAVVSAICAAAEPRSAAGALRSLLETQRVSRPSTSSR